MSNSQRTPAFEWDQTRTDHGVEHLVAHWRRDLNRARRNILPELGPLTVYHYLYLVHTLPLLRSGGISRHWEDMLRRAVPERDSHADGDVQHEIANELQPEIKSYDGNQALSSFLLLPPEIRMLIYKCVIPDILRLRWRPSSKVRSDDGYHKGVFGLMWTCRLIRGEFGPFFQRTTYAVNFQQVGRYVLSTLCTQHTLRELCITIDPGHRATCDFLPIVRLKKQYPRYKITFQINSDKYHTKVASSLSLLVNILGKPDSLVNTICKNIHISWRDWDAPFIIWIPVWYNSHENMIDLELEDESLGDYLGIGGLRRDLNFRVRGQDRRRP